MEHNYLNDIVDQIKSHYSTDFSLLREILDCPFTQFGRFIRNYYNLWDKNNEIVKWFKSTYDIDHADDITSIIFYSIKQDLNREERDIESVVSKIKEYWKEQKSEHRQYSTRIN